MNKKRIKWASGVVGLVVILGLSVGCVRVAAAEGAIVQSVTYEGRLPKDAVRLFDGLTSEVVQGRQLSKAEAIEFAQRATAVLRAAGYPVATVVLTEAGWSKFEATGLLELRVFEGDVGRVVVTANGSAVSTTRIERTVERALCGRRALPCALTSTGLGRAQLLLQDLPGVKLEPVSLSPDGVKVGQTAVAVSVAPSQRRLTGTLGVDNYGVSSTGVNRLGGAFEADNLFHMGDMWQISAVRTSERQTTGSFGLSLPLGYEGWRITANAARTNYALPQVNASGLANSGSVGISYPITRGLNRNWLASLDGFDVMAKQEVAGQSAAAPSHLEGVRLGLSGNAGDRPKDFGLDYWSVNAGLTAGQRRQDIGGVDTTGTTGFYTKLALSAFDKQRLGQNWYALVSARGQAASRNLDGYEAMSMGGIGGVRAYSSSEGSLDQGVFVSGEIRRLVSLPRAGQLAPGVFIDYIAGNVLHSTYTGWQTSQGYASSTLANYRWLAGWGFGLDWVAPNQLVNASVTIAWKLPGSPDSVYHPGSARGRVLFSMGLKF